MFGLLRSRSESEKQTHNFIKNRLGIRPGNLGFYVEAFRHKSVAREKGMPDNERLEFLGDAIIDTIVAEYLFEQFPTKNEGSLTQMKSRVVSRKTLGDLGVKIGLEEVVSFVDGKYVNKNTICGNAFEALVGALYLDKGFKSSRTVVRKILKTHLDLEKVIREDQDYKSQILVWSQKTKTKLAFRELRVEDLGHEKMYYFEVQANGKSIGTGNGKSKKKAEQQASQDALSTMGLLD